MYSTTIHIIRQQYDNTYNRSADLTSTAAAIKRPLTNQMRLVYPINQSDAY
jgi:hypothetical protein